MNSPLQAKEQEQLLSQFPKNVKLSYENLLHNKVFPDRNYTNGNENQLTNDKLYLAIPKGRKAFFWFHQQMLYSLTLSLSNREVERIQVIQENFSPAFYNTYDETIFYGTLFYLPGIKKQCISLEDVYYYRGEFVSSRFYLEKLGFLEEFLKNSKNNNSNNNLLWGIPILSTSYNELLKKIVEQDKVTIYCIQQRFLKENKPILKILYTPAVSNKLEPQPKLGINIVPDKRITTNTNINTNTNTNTNTNNNIMKINVIPSRIQNAQSNKPNTVYNIQTKQFPKKRIFQVKADLQNDIYHLYDENDNYVDVAYIPDYKTSVMMNKLFRKIKENDNLDALEESDDEEEFEDQREDRFVDLEKKIRMECTWHPKFKHWVGGHTSPLPPPPC